MTPPITPHDYALTMGWDYTQIEATADLGVSDYDAEALKSTDITPAALLAWCKQYIRETTLAEKG